MKLHMNREAEGRGGDNGQLCSLCVDVVRRAESLIWISQSKGIDMSYWK